MLQVQLDKWYHLTKEELRTKSQQSTKEVAKAFFVFLTKEKEIVADIESNVELERDLMYQLVTKRSIAINLDINKSTKMFISAFLCDRPGKGTAVIYLSYLRRAQQYRHKLIDMQEFSYIFPNGFLNEKSLDHLWHNQKLTAEIRKDCRLTSHAGSDNLLDQLHLFKENLSKEEQL